MPENVVLQLIPFFVATTFSVVASHIGLIRLIGNASTKPPDAIEREKSGVLIVVEFALVILTLAPSPFAARLVDANATDQFAWPSWVTPFVTFVLALVDLLLSKFKGGWYYNVVVIAVLIISAGMLAAHRYSSVPRVEIFFWALVLCLLVIVVQFLKSALRLRSTNTMEPETVPPRPILRRALPNRVPQPSECDFKIERPHALIRASQKGLPDVRTDYDTLLLIGGHGRLDLRVSLAALPRALWIMDRFVKRFEQEGFQVEVEDWTTSVIVDGRRIPVRMRENVNRFEKPRDEREHAWHKYNYVANGALTFHIFNDWGSTKKYSDATRSRLEEKLESVVAGLLEERERIRRAEEEKRAREVMHQYEARAEAESERRRSEMQKRIQDLTVDVDAWHQSKRIRAYLAAFQETAEEWSGQIDAKSDIGKWLIWARQPSVLCRRA